MLEEVREGKHERTGRRSRRSSSAATTTAAAPFRSASKSAAAAYGQTDRQTDTSMPEKRKKAYV